MSVRPRLWSRETFLAFLGAVVSSMALWPSVWFAGRSFYSTDAVLAAEPWRSELGLGVGHPHNPELGDHDVYIFPQLAFVQRYWHEHGELPLWNPGVYAGVPLDGNPQVALLYPFHLLLPLFQRDGEPFSPWRLSRGLSWMGIARFVLAAAFAYLWLRRLGGRWWLAAIGAAFVAAGPYPSLWRMHTPEQVFSLVPMALFFLEGLLAGGGGRAFAGLALALGVSNLGGYPQTSLFFGLLIVIYALLRGAGRRRRIAAGAAAVVLAAGIAAPAWWPFLTYLQESGVALLRREAGLHPSGVTLWQVLGGGALAAALLLLVPRIARRSVPAVGFLAAAVVGAAALGGGDGQAVHWLVAGITGHPVQAPPFVGVPVGRPFLEMNQDHLGVLLALLVLAGRGSAVATGRWLLVLVLAMGSGFPLLHQLLRLALPLIEPSRVACLVPLAVAALLVVSGESLLAMSGAERAQRLRSVALALGAFLVPTGAALALVHGRLHLGPADVAALLLLCAVALRPARGGWVVSAIAVVGLLHAVAPTRDFQPSLTASEVYPETATLEFLEARAEDHRVFACDPGVLPGNSMLVYGLRQSLGADGLEPRRYLELLINLDYPRATPRAEWRVGSLAMLGTPLFDLLGARLVVAPAGSRLPAHFRVLRETSTLVVAENPRAAPAAWLATSSYVMQDQAMELLARPPQEQVGFDRGAVPVLDGAPSRNSRLEVRRRGVHELAIATETDGAAYLVVCEGNVRGWHATLDDVPTAIYRAFGAYRCVGVPAGRHVVRFSYAPYEFWWGLVLAAAVVVAAAGIALGSALRERAVARALNPRT